MIAPQTLGLFFLHPSLSGLARAVLWGFWAGGGRPDSPLHPTHTPAHPVSAPPRPSVRHSTLDSDSSNSLRSHTLRFAIDDLGNSAAAHSHTTHNPRYHTAPLAPSSAISRLYANVFLLSLPPARASHYFVHTRKEKAASPLPRRRNFATDPSLCTRGWPHPTSIAAFPPILPRSHHAEGAAPTPRHAPPPPLSV